MKLAAVIAAALAFLLVIRHAAQRPCPDRDSDAGFWEAGW